jgi:hypothetical protein
MWLDECYALKIYISIGDVSLQRDLSAHGSDYDVGCDAV